VVLPLSPAHRAHKEARISMDRRLADSDARAADPFLSEKCHVLDELKVFFVAKQVCTLTACQNVASGTLSGTVLRTSHP